MGKTPPLTYIAQLNGTRPVTCKRGKEGKEERRKKTRRREQREEVGWVTNKWSLSLYPSFLMPTVWIPQNISA